MVSFYAHKVNSLLFFHTHSWEMYAFSLASFAVCFIGAWAVHYNAHKNMWLFSIKYCSSFFTQYAKDGLAPVRLMVDMLFLSFLLFFFGLKIVSIHFIKYKARNTLYCPWFSLSVARIIDSRSKRSVITIHFIHHRVAICTLIKIWTLGRFKLNAESNI